MRIDELVWDDWNEDHISRHGVRPEEVEEAVFDRAALLFEPASEPSTAIWSWGSRRRADICSSFLSSSEATRHT